MVNSLIEIALGNALMTVGLAVLVAGVGRTWRHPVLLHSLWVLVLVKLLTPPLISISVDVPAVVESIAVSSGSQAELFSPTEVTARWIPNWSTLLLSLWAAGSALFLVILVVRAYRFRELLAHGTEPDGSLRKEAEQLSASMGLKRCPKISLVPGQISPFMWAMGRIEIVLPTDLLQRLDTEAKTTLLAHELAHVKRRDHWIRFLEVATTVLFWWHPVMWWARGNIQENEELCCDLLVLEVMPTVAKTYAGTLISTLDSLSGAKLTLPLTASGISFKDSLKRRLTMIMERSTPRSVPVSGRVLMLVLGTTLILTPVWAQTSAQNVEEKVEKTVEAVGIEEEIQRKVEKAVDEGVIDKEIKQAIREDIEKLGEDIEKMVEQALAEADMAKAVAKSVASLNIDGIVEEALRTAHKMVQGALGRAQIDRIVEEAMGKVERAKQEIQEAKEELENMIQLNQAPKPTPQEN